MDIRDLKAASEHAQSGIYAISNLINFKIYIGSAINIKERFKNHKKKLKYGKHPNKHLQAAYDKIGENCFSFDSLEYCCKEQLLEREQFWINLTECCNPDFGYNKRKIPNSNLGLKFSDETKRKQSLAQLGHTRNKGKKHTIETKLKVSLANKGKPKPHFRNNEKWPHELGYKCKCDECKFKKNELEKERLLKIRRENGIKPIRKIDKWPHKEGSLCKCDECKTKLNAAKLATWHKRRTELNNGR